MINFPVGIFFGIVAFVAWGLSDFCATYSARNASATKTFFWSQFVALILYIIFFAIFFSALPPITLQEWLLVVLMTVAVIGGFLSYYKGLSVDKVAIVTSIGNAWPVVTLILALAFLGQSLGPGQAVAATIIILGSLLLSFRIKRLSEKNIKGIAPGVVYAIMGAIMFGVAFTVLDPLVASLGFFIPIFLQKCIQIPLSFMALKAVKIDLSFPKRVAFPVIFMGFLEFGGLVSYNLAIESEFTALIAPLIAASPMVTIFLASLFFKERIRPLQWLGVFLIISGIIMLSV